jgi:pimeloyl-ACP methyl ester carboxylesterase
MSARIFKSDAGRARLENWYERFLSRVGVPVAHQVIQTSRGPSHVLIAGEESKPPLVTLHGSLASSAHVVSEMGPLLKRFRVIAPDLPGQSVRGPQVRLPLNDDSLARWLLETLDGLGVEKFDLFGVSWGGFVARLTASAAPERVRRLVLLVPAGIVNGPVWEGITQIAVPMFMYRLFPSEDRLRRLFEPMFTTWDSDWAAYMGDAFRIFALDLRIPPLATDEQLRKLKPPTFVLGGSDDLSFPGEKMIDRIEAVAPQVKTMLIAGSKHCPPTTNEFRNWMAYRVVEFLESEAPSE